MFVPDGWTELNWLRDTAITGFSAGVYRNGSEIVIGFTGTNGSLLADSLVGNVPAWLGVSSPQVAQAAALVMDVMRANPGVEISFTGHSLGGGLASVMAVLFDKRASVFDPAPFERTARNPETLQGLSDLLTTLGYRNSAFEAYVAGGGIDFSTRENNVSSWHVDGEFLEPIRMLGNSIVGIGQETELTIGAPSLTATSDVVAGFRGAVNLHSISLLHALLLSPAFKAAITAQPYALEVFFDPRLYAQDPEVSNTPDFLINLLLQHVGNVAAGRPSNSILDALAADLLSIGSAGTTGSERVTKALLAAATEHHQFAVGATSLFDVHSGGTHFSIADLREDLTKSRALPLLTAAARAVSPRDREAFVDFGKQQSWHIQSGLDALIWSDAAGRDDLAIGGSGNDSLQGGAGNDILLGLDGADTLAGGAGTDTLIGGAGNDAYVVGSGKDTVRDDLAGDGMIRTETGITLAGGKGAGKRNTWVGPNNEIYTFAPTAAAQLGTLTVTGLGAGNDVRVENFDLAQAEVHGYLGIKLDPAARIIIEEAGGTSPFGPFAFDPAAVTGRSAIAEGGGRAYTIYLNVAASAGDTVTLALPGLGDGFQAVLGSTTVPADGAVITLTEGQTQVSFGLLHTGDVAADASGSLSATYTRPDGSATSNIWTIDLADAGDTAQALDGDRTYATFIAPGDIHRDGRIVVNAGETAYVIGADGNLVPGAGITVVDNTLYGSEANDRINGLTGNDALNGAAGNDRLDGGDGDDLLAGGAGNNEIEGGAGNDFILGAGNLAGGLQPYGPNDTWQAPLGKLVYGNGTTWGVYRDSDILTVWDGVANAGAGAAANAIDAGDGNDRVIAGAGDDRIQGGSGDDWLDGTAGADLIEGGDGNDRIQADGIVKEGYLTTVTADHHGHDFADGGLGDDDIEGGGNADVLFGGMGADRIFGDRGGRTDDEFFVHLAAHGADYIDGEDGDDYLEGGGGDDTIYGGAGSDRLWGDTTADHIVGDGAGQSAADLHALAWGNDTLDGGDGHDDMVGGGKDDTLHGGLGNDRLWGDHGNAALPGEHHGADYLDGGEGDDVLVGGGSDDSLLGGDGADQLLGDDNEAKLAGAFHGSDRLDGGTGNDLLIGGGGDDTLFGGDGDDMLAGDAGGSGGPEAEFHGDDYLEGGDGHDVLAGGGKGDTLIGGGGNDVLDGGSGADYLAGGAGDDTYVMDDAGDIVVEVADEGIDHVVSSIGLFLPDNVEHLTLTGTDAIDATGTPGDDVLVGSDGANALAGMGGDDTLVGGGGTDVLSGGGGNDYLAGGAGDDVYVFNRGGGQDAVDNTDRTDATDTVRFGTGITDADVVAWRSGDDVIVKIKGATDVVALLDYYGASPLDGGAATDHRIDRIEFTNGATWDEALIQSAVDRAAANRAPTVASYLPVLQARAGDAFTYTVPDGTIADPDAGDSVAYSVTMPDGSVVPAWLAFDAATRTLSGTPPAGDVGSLRFVLWGTDDYGVASGQHVTLDVAPPNRAPALATALADQAAALGALFTYVVPATAFADPDAGDPLAYSATLADGSALPAWLGFDPATRTFSGTPGGTGIVSVRVTATDPGNLSAADVFDIAVESGLVVDGTEAGEVLSGGPGPDSLRGFGGDDTLLAGDGDDRLDGGAGDDTLTGEGGADTYVFGIGYGTETLRDHDATGAPARDVIELAAGVAPGDLRASRLYGDTLLLNIAATGDRVMVVDHFIESPAGTANWSIEEIRFADGTVWDAAKIRTLVMAGTDDDDHLYGYDSDDVLDGGLGNDYVSGRGGADTVRGGSGDDSLYGGDGDDVLDGGPGDDLLHGDSGNDIYVFGKGSGHDVLNNIDYNADRRDIVLFASNVAVADVTATRSGDALILTIGATGDSLYVRDHFSLNGGYRTYRIDQVRFADGTTWNNDDFDRLASSVTLTGTSGADTLNGGAGDDTLSGLAGNDRLNGNAGNDRLDGGAGGDTLAGGAGNDLYLVDSTADLVAENPGEGTDTVQSSVTHTLAANVEHLTLTGTSAINGTGNALANILTGNGANNTLAGGSGNDRLDGSGGGDKLVGGTGDDVYIVDDAGDAITESSNAGVDTVESSVTHTLETNVEHLVLTGAAAINGTGNALANVLTGNSAANVLSGGAGADTLVGGVGDDSYVVDNALDVVTENAGEGIDGVQSGITHALAENLEVLVLTGTKAVNGTGNAVANLLRGNSANNALNGGGDVDILEGGAGNDSLTDATDAALFDGGAGADVLTGGAGAQMFLGGKGNDTLITGAGDDLLLFNKGNGQDTLAAGESGRDTLSLGGGIRYTDLSFVKASNDLVLKLGPNDRITFKDWYAATPSRSVVNLQVIAEAMSDFAPDASDPLRDDKVECFDFGGLVGAFDAARAADASLTGWALSSALASFHSDGSDSAALGGDLAYQYGLHGTLAGIGMVPALNVLADPAFGSSAQALTALAGLQVGSQRLT